MQIVLRNIMEDYVIVLMDQILETSNCCKCEQCRLDMASYALNRLPAKYVVSTQGELLTKLCSFDKQFEAHTVATIAQAIEVIAKNPRHTATPKA